MEKASKINRYHYNPKLKERARQLRSKGTKSEVYLWKYVLKKNSLRYKFKRQRPVLHYIADFMCTELLLIIELDGITHFNDEARRKDAIRQKKLEEIGFTVLRFNDDSVFNFIDGVQDKIEVTIQELEKTLCLNKENLQ